MEIKLYATGPAFPPKGISIPEAIQTLSSFAATYSNCLDLATRLTSKNRTGVPTLRIKTINSNSLDTVLTVDFPVALAAMTPLVPAYPPALICHKSWEILCAVFKVLGSAAKIFKSFGKAPTYNFTNCTDVTVNVNEGTGEITAPKFMKKVLHKAQPHINDIAKLVQSNKIEKFQASTSLSQDEIRDLPLSLFVDEENCEDYTTNEIEEVDDSVVDIKCRPYIINKNTRVGKLDYHDGNRWVSSISFSIESGDINDYIDSMKSDSTVISARRKFVVNTLGERKINHLSLVAVRT